MNSYRTFVRLSVHSNWGLQILCLCSIRVHDERHVLLPCRDIQTCDDSVWRYFILVLQAWLDRSSTRLICCALKFTLKKIIIAIFNGRPLEIQTIMNNSPVPSVTTTTNANISMDILLPKSRVMLIAPSVGFIYWKKTCVSRIEANMPLQINKMLKWWFFKFLSKQWTLKDDE